MASLFDLEKLASLLRDFYQITSIRITVFDENMRELISYPDRVAPYCEVIRGSGRGFSACMACDRAACQTAGKKKGTHIYRCHAGFTEAVTPIFIGEILAGYLLFGHIYPYEDPDAGWQEIKARVASLQVNTRMLQEALQGARYVPEATVRSAAHILRAVATYLIMERMASLQQDRLAVRLDSYLSAHFTEKITVEDLCQALGIGKTQLYKLSHQIYGMGISQRVRALRIGLAKDLLLSHEDYSLSDISDQCGFSDYNYFISVFSREVGQSPAAWRRAHLQSPS